MRRIHMIVIHHSLTPDSVTLSWPAIRGYHTKEHGWTDIGYHVGIERVRGDYEILIGRPWHLVGAHARGANAHSLGVCIVGNFNLFPPVQAHWDCAVRTVSWLARLFDVERSHVLGHREVSAHRSCPGTAFDLPAFRRALRL